MTACGLDDRVGRDTGNDQMADAKPVETLLQTGLVKRIDTTMKNDCFTRDGRHPLVKFGTPGPVDHRPTCCDISENRAVLNNVAMAGPKSNPYMKNGDAQFPRTG